MKYWSIAFLGLLVANAFASASDAACIANVSTINQWYGIKFTASLSYQDHPETDGTPGMDMGSTKGWVIFNPSTKVAQVVLEDGRRFPISSFNYFENQCDFVRDFSMDLDSPTMRALGYAANSSFWHSKSTENAAAQILDRYLAEHPNGMVVSMSDEMNPGGCASAFGLTQCSGSQRIVRRTESLCLKGWPFAYPEGFGWLKMSLDSEVQALR